jgi:hypothetical protein
MVTQQYPFLAEKCDAQFRIRDPKLYRTQLPAVATHPDWVKTLMSMRASTPNRRRLLSILTTDMRHQQTDDNAKRQMVKAKDAALFQFYHMYGSVASDPLFLAHQTDRVFGLEAFGDDAAQWRDLQFPAGGDRDDAWLRVHF